MSHEQLLAAIHAHGQAMADARAVYGSRLAEDFRMLSFVDVHENKISEFLAFLLDPTERHEQGAAFLKLFLERIEWDRLGADLQKASVSLEAATDFIRADRRRIDILVKSERGALAIENKPWAQDQDRQLADYLSHLDASCGEQHCIVYLTPAAHRPAAKSIAPTELDRRLAAGQVKLLSYTAVIAWLRDCRGVCRAARVTTFLEELEWLIRDRILMEPEVGDDAGLVQLMLRSRENASAALELAAAVPGLKKSLFAVAVRAVEHQAKDRPDWSFEADLDCEWNPGVWVWYGDSNLGFGVEFYRNTFDTPYIGVKRKGGVRDDGRVYEAMKALAGAARREAIWPWWRYPSYSDDLWRLGDDWETNPDPWLGLGDGQQFAADYMNAAERVHKALVEAGLVGLPR